MLKQAAWPNLIRKNIAISLRSTLKYLFLRVSPSLEHKLLQSAEFGKWFHAKPALQETNQGLNVALSSKRRSFRESFKTDPTFNKNREQTHTRMLHVGSCPCRGRPASGYYVLTVVSHLIFHWSLWLQYAFYSTGTWSNTEREWTGYENGIGIFLSSLLKGQKAFPLFCSSNKPPPVILKQEHTFNSVKTFIETESLQRKSKAVNACQSGEGNLQPW